MTVAYAASGEPPFGTGESMAILYRILHESPDVAAVPAALRPLVTSALAKDPRRRPTARELLDRLADPAGRDDRPAMAVLASTWPSTRAASLLLEPATAPSAGPRRLRPVRLSRRTALIGGPALAVAAVAALVSGLLMGHVITLGQLAANQFAPVGTTTAALDTYPGQQRRGVFQAINRVVASGGTIVALGSQASDGVVRPQFFVSADGGKTWRLAPLRAAAGVGGGLLRPGTCGARGGRAEHLLRHVPGR